MKSFIIRLKNHDFSRTIADQCVAQAKTFGVDVEYFDAVTGDEAQAIFDRDGIHKYPQKLKRNTAGVQGCAGSHYLLWKQCIADNVPYLVLEQDGYMIRSLPDVLDQFDHVLKLDNNDPFADDYNQQVAQDHSQSVIPYNVNWGYKKKAAPYGGYFKGAWAYIIKPVAAEKLVHAFKTNGWVPADKQFGVDILNLHTTASTVFRIHPTYTSDNIEQLSLTRNL
jgi:GR25 family glycosyltransferase involved in LPS biosynthesis